MFEIFHVDSVETEFCC